MKKDYDERKRIGGLLRAARLKAGMTQRDVAEATGFNYANIAKIELGRYGVGIDVLSIIARSIGCHVSIEPGAPPAFGKD